MRALILAAGRGTRLEIASTLPKCLTTVGNRTLLDRYLDVLDALAIPVTIVVGHGAAHIRDHVAARANAPTLVTNERYTQGSIVSLLIGLSAMQVEGVSGDLLLLDGDVAFTPSLLARLQHHSASNALLVDIGTVFIDEQYMAGINATRVIVLRRGPVDGHDAQGEWVGFAKLSATTATQFHAAVREKIERGETTGGYEDALAGLLATHQFTAVATDGEPWVEIDFADDLARARELFG